MPAATGLLASCSLLRCLSSTSGLYAGSSLLSRLTAGGLALGCVCGCLLGRARCCGLGCLLCLPATAGCLLLGSPDRDSRRSIGILPLRRIAPLRELTLFGFPELKFIRCLRLFGLLFLFLIRLILFGTSGLLFLLRLVGLGKLFHDLRLPSTSSEQLR